MIRKVYFLILLLSSFLFLGCSSTTVEPKDFTHSTIKTRYKFFSNLRYDTYGRPLFEGDLNLRPTYPNIRYYIVEYNNSKVASYFLVNSSEPEGEYENTMKYIYEDTFTGLTVGFAGSYSASSSVNMRGNGSEFLLIFFGLPIIGTVGGFIYGVGHSSYDLAIQMNKDFYMDYEENLISYAKLEYDSKNRLINLHEYNHVKQKVQTRQYAYNVYTSELCQTKINNGTTRSIFYQDECY